jgi:L-alanine-DL-glutamate epimerase-like enolase superfamily enzyme
VDGSAQVAGVRATAYRFPAPAPQADGTLEWDATTMVVAEVRCADVVGLGWTYADAACVPLIEGVLAAAVTGRPALDVPACWLAMQQRVRNLGRVGLVSCALSAVDTALWDAAARLAGLPLVQLLGKVHDEVALYGSGGFVSSTDEELRDELLNWVGKRHIPRVKIKIGESWGRATNRDLSRVYLARKVIGPDAELYVDANGAFPVGTATRMAARLAEYDVAWFEEPVSSDDLNGLRLVRASSPADVTAGEYGYDLPYFARMLDAEAVDCLQVDVTRCGGYTEWRRIAAVAAAHNIDVSAHCAPNLTAPVAAATPNFRHLEWFADHDRIESTYLDGAFDPTGGAVHIGLDAPGHGMTFKSADAEPFRVS